MQLEINKNDKSFDTNEILKKRQIIRSRIAGCLTVVALFSGSVLGLPKAYATEISPPSYSQTDTKQIVEIPEIYRDDVLYFLGKNKDDVITVDDLKNYSGELALTISDDSSLSWLNYCENLESLIFYPYVSDLSILSEIKGLNGLKKIEILSFATLNKQGVDFTYKDFSFLVKSKNLEELSLEMIHIEPGFVEKLTQLKKLKIWGNENCKIDFSKLTFLEELDLSYNEIYNIVIDFTREEYELLKDAGVRVIFSTNEMINKSLEEEYLSVCDKLDRIVLSLSVNENSTDQEKLDAILIYVLDNLTYDPDVSDLIYNGQDVARLSSTFYDGGTLYGALEKSTSICGNYAALVQALASRLGLKSYYITSTNHAWNVVNVNGENYYVDATWLDGEVISVELPMEIVVLEDGNIMTTQGYTFIRASEVIRTGDVSELDWYMADPINYPDSNKPESHEVLYLPSFIKLKPLKEENEIITTENISVDEDVVQIETIENLKDDIDEEVIKITEDDKYEVQIGGKKWIVGGALVIGILAAFGGAIKIVENKKRRRRELERKRQEALFYSQYGYFYDSPYSHDSYNSRGRK